MRICSKCSIEKPLADFYKNKGQCKSCMAAYMREYYVNNPEKAEDNRLKQRERDKKVNRFYKHGITEKIWLDMLGRFNGMCWSCKERPATVIDHDHSCCDKMFSCGNCIRGVLCHQCNTALGLLKDNYMYIENLLVYI